MEDTKTKHVLLEKLPRKSYITRKDRQNITAVLVKELFQRLGP